MTLEKWMGWRDAESVHLIRVEAKMIPDATTALQSFRAGEFDACIDVQTCVPTEEFESLQGTSELSVNPGLGVQFIGLNVKNVPDVNERRALALAIDRMTIVEEVTKASGSRPRASLRKECPASTRSRRTSSRRPPTLSGRSSISRRRRTL